MKHFPIWKFDETIDFHTYLTPHAIEDKEKMGKMNTLPPKNGMR